MDDVKIKNKVSYKNVLRLLMIILPIVFMLIFMWNMDRVHQNSEIYFSSSKYPTKEQMDRITNVIVNRNHSLSEEERAYILDTYPSIGNYRMAADYRQYSFHWDLPTGREVSASFTGILTEIDPNNIEGPFLNR